MKIDFNPHAAAQAQNARGPQAQATLPAPEGSDDGVTITLSQAAKQILKMGDADYDGKSPAHQARQFIANNLATAAAEDGEVPNFSGSFGQLVKTFAPGHNKEPEVVEEPDAVPEDGGETAPVGETADSGETGATDGSDTTVAEGSDGSGDTGTTDGGDTSATDGGDTTVVVAPEAGDGPGIGETDPAVAVEEPDIIEVLDESAPTDGEASDGGGVGPEMNMHMTNPCTLRDPQQMRRLDQVCGVTEKAAITSPGHAQRHGDGSNKRARSRQEGHD